MNTMLTTTGEGMAIVTVEYTVDADCDVEITAVMFNAVDIKDALTVEQFNDLQAEALKRYEADCDIDIAEMRLERMEA